VETKKLNAETNCSIQTMKTLTFLTGKPMAVTHSCGNTNTFSRHNTWTITSCQI